MKVAIFHTNDGTDVRISKICRTISKWWTVYFVGCDRWGTFSHTNLGKAKTIILRRPTSFGRFNFTSMLFYYFHAFTFLFRTRPEVIIVVNEENVLFLSFYKFLFRKVLICEIFDSLLLRTKSTNKFKRYIFKLISNYALKVCDAIIVTDNDRKNLLHPKYRSKAIITSNYPYYIPAIKPYIFSTKASFRLYLCGTLNSKRGINQVSQAIKAIPGAKIVAAGWIYDQAAKDLIASDFVEYLGVLDDKTSLEVAASCDAILCFYEPISVNNIYASPNKIYDAILVRKPIIINSEVNVADFVTQNNIGFSCSYYDVSALEAILLKISKSNYFYEGPISTNFIWEVNEPKYFELLSKFDKDVS